MKPTPEIIAIVNQTPDLDQFGKVHGMPWPENEKIYDSLLKAGEDGIRQVVGMLHDIDDGVDYKPRYVLHGLVMYCGRSEKDASRKLLCETLCSELAEDYPSSVRGYLLRQLQLCGDGSSAASIGAWLLDEENWEYAAQALQAIGGDDSLAQFRTSLPKEFRASLPKAENSDKQTLTILQALGTFRDAPSAPAIRDYLKHQNEAIRLSAAWALAMMADAEAVPGLLGLIDNAKGWERLQAIDCSLTLADQLEAAGRNDEATKIRDHVKSVKETPEPVT